MFVVTREGVYRHEIGGVFSTLDAAINASIDYLKAERDGYHYYAVIPLVVNERLPAFDGGSMCAPFEEPAPQAAVVRPRVYPTGFVHLDYPFNTFFKDNPPSFKNWIMIRNFTTKETRYVEHP